MDRITNPKNILSALSAICALGTAEVKATNHALQADWFMDLIHDFSRVAEGGLRRGGSSRALMLTGIELRHDRWSFHLDAAVQRGSDGSEDVGDIQAYSNIDEADFNALYEAWVELTAEDDAWRLKLGQVDANSEFAFVDHGAEFINSSMGFSPTLATFPTYPSPALSANAFVKSTVGDWGVGIYADTEEHFNETFYVGQWRHKIAEIQLSLGYWHQQGDFEAVNPDKRQSYLSGWYATAEGDWQSSWAEGAGWFAQWGQTDDSYSDIGVHLGVGVAWYGLWHRESDVLGIGVTHVQTRDGLAGPETAWEFFYRYQMTSWLSVKPDIQWIQSPASQAGIDDALVFTLRTEMSF